MASSAGGGGGGQRTPALGQQMGAAQGNQMMAQQQQLNAQAAQNRALGPNADRTYRGVNPRPEMGPQAGAMAAALQSNGAPPPPAGMIAAPGQAAPFNPHFINFLGDPRTPATGLTPAMLQQINASNGPGGGMRPQPIPDPRQDQMRNMLAALQAPPSQADRNRQYMDDWHNRNQGGGSRMGGYGSVAARGGGGRGGSR